MPNWCANLLTVTGPEDEVERFCRTVETGMGRDRALDAAAHILAGQTHTDDDIKQLAATLTDDNYQSLSFAKTVPSGPDQDENIQRWGTKWDACDPWSRRPR